MSTDPSASSTTHDFGRVRSAVSSLERAIRSHRLHEGRGPTVGEHIDAATEQLTELAERGPLALRVSSFGLLYENRPLTGSREVDATWFGLFGDSVRELTFQPGLSREEVATFVEVLCAEPDEGDDRVTLLWRREVHQIQLYVSSLLPARLEAGPDGDIRLVTEDGAASLFGPREDAPGSSVLAFSRDDPRSLVGSEGFSWMAKAQAHPVDVGPWVEEALQSGGARARGSDVGRFVAALLSARPTGEGGMPPLLSVLLENLLARDTEDRLLPLLSSLAENESPAAAVILGELARPEFMVRLAPRCDLDPEGFEAVIAALGRADPAGLSALLVELRSPEAQTHFARLAGDTGGDVLPFYLQQLDSDDERETLGAVDALAALTDDRGLPGLAKAMTSTSDRVRYQALRALGGRYHHSLAATLVGILEDARRVHRLLALKILEKSDELRVLRGITAAMKSPTFLERDPEEQAAWLRSLATFADAEGVETLGHLLGLRSAARKSVARLQLLVVEALAASENPGARKLLADAKGRWQLGRSVRKAIAEALAESTTS